VEHEFMIYFLILGK